MLRSHRITTFVLATACVLPAPVAAHAQDLRSPDTRDMAMGLRRDEAQRAAPRQDLRAPDTRDVAMGVGREEPQQDAPRQDLRSPDSRDLARGFVPQVSGRPIILVREVPVSGFEWGAAGIGAAGTLGLLAILAGALVAGSSRRRRKVPVAAR